MINKIKHKIQTLSYLVCLLLLIDAKNILFYLLSNPRKHKLNETQDLIPYFNITEEYEHYNYRIG